MKKTFLLLITVSLTLSTLHAQDTLFGEAGSGQPTKTVLGILGGAAVGSALGGGLGGHDGWWIGALTGSTIGGIAGNQWGAADAHNGRTVSTRRIYRYETRPVMVRRYVKEVVTTDDSVPYGYMSGGEIKSPWSSFAMSVGGKSSGDILYDPNTGQAFRIP
ncbi:MAG: hypothetical protein ACOY3I_09245 [Verrucomicrobiota bacterium]